MNHYELLHVPKNATTEEIKQHYHQFAKIHHPDKGGDEETFKQINEAYHVLMDPIKRYEYDMKLNDMSYTFTQDDYELIYKYYNTFINSVEVRLMVSLLSKLPKQSKRFTNLSDIFKKKTTSTTSTSTTLIKTDAIKYIDATQLYDTITLHLKRSLQDVFKRILKIIIVRTRQTYYHLYITDSDYNIHLYNDDNSMINLELRTLPSLTFYKKGYDLYYVKKLDIYEYYYGTTFSLRLPNKFTICCIASELIHKKSSSIDTFGFYNPRVKGRGKLLIVYKVNHEAVSDTHKETLRTLFHRKEIFIDPSLPVYQI